MIELLLQAERALSVGLLDRAETLYEQVARADPRNSIAVVGLARVTLDRGDEHGALDLARRALAIDPENDAARRMVARLEEVIDYRVRRRPRWPGGNGGAGGGGGANGVEAAEPAVRRAEPEAAEATEPEAAEAAEDLETGTEREAETDGAAEPAAATEAEPERPAATEPKPIGETDH